MRTILFNPEEFFAHHGSISKVGRGAEAPPY